MTRHEFTHSYNGTDNWVFEMDPVVGPKGLRYRLRAEQSKQWTECILRTAPRGGTIEELQRAVIDWEARILRPTGTPNAA